MLYTRIQPQGFLGSGEEYIKCCFFFFFVFSLPYMDMVAILFNGVEPFEQIVNIPLTEGSMSNLVKISQAVTEKKIFKITLF